MFSEWYRHLFFAILLFLRARFFPFSFLRVIFGSFFLKLRVCFHAHRLYNVILVFFFLFFFFLSVIIDVAIVAAAACADVAVVIVVCFTVAVVHQTSSSWLTWYIVHNVQMKVNVYSIFCYDSCAVFFLLSLGNIADLFLLHWTINCLLCVSMHGGFFLFISCLSVIYFDNSR